MSDWNNYGGYDQGNTTNNQDQSNYGGGFYDSSVSYDFGENPTSNTTSGGQTGSNYGMNSSGYGGSVGSLDPSNPEFRQYQPPPNNANDGQFGGNIGEDQFADEPPLLEELGINTEHIMQKTLSVLNPFRATRADVAGDADLAGPLVFCLAFGSLLLLSGKVHFNYIYGIGVLGCLAMYSLLSMMAVQAEVHFTVIVSVLGYCILPIVGLSAASIIFSLQGVIGNVLAVGAILWCSLSSSKLFITAFNMEHQQPLVAYPCSLLYAVFALITVF